MNIALWIVQVLLAALFVFSGVMKFVMPVEEMTKQMPSMPGWFLHFIGLAELLGGLGLVLPGLVRVATHLTPLAAAGLVVIMLGATVVSAMIGPVAMALLPLVVGVLAAFVAYGRWRVVPLTGGRKIGRPVEALHKDRGGMQV
jgi:uncharacterized membrane protein YphA (DoxX/SURF4 family)